MTTLTTTERVRVEVHYDQVASNPLDDAPFGTIVTISGRDLSTNGEWVRDPDGVGVHHLVHEHMRGVKIAARVDVSGGGFMYVTPEDVTREYGANTPATRADALRLLTARASEYRAWADGMTFGFTLTRERQCATCEEWSEADGDSVWGFTTRNPQRDLRDWMGEYMDDRGKRALSAALDAWTGEYPVAATATI